jgi:hypothetical protein
MSSSETLHVFMKGSDLALCGETRDGAKPDDGLTPDCPVCRERFIQKYGTPP